MTRRLQEVSIRDSIDEAIKYVMNSLVKFSQPYTDQKTLG